MSASIGVYVATALFLAIGGDSEEAMRGEPQWDDGTPQCQAKIARGIACERNRGGNSVRLWQLRNSQGSEQVERSWEQISGGRLICEIGQSGTRGQCIPRGRIEEIILSPRWVPSGEPTNVGTPGFWMKLQL